MMEEILDLRRQIEEKDAVNSQMVRSKSTLVQGMTYCCPVKRILIQ